jgi:thioredoxin-like negative regulator of GroEL
VPAYRPLDPAEPPAIAAAGGLLVVHFWAPWNGADRKYNPALVPVRDHFGTRAVFRSANVDDPACDWVRMQCQVVNVPTVAGLLAGHRLGALVGLRPAADLATFVGAWVRKTPPVIDPRWRTGDVLGVARGIAHDQALDRLPLLADALMDAGCADDQVLAACRGAAPSWWVVDLILGGG